MKRGPLVIASVCFFAGFALIAHGQFGEENEAPEVIPTFAVDVVVGPASGAIHIPPSDPTSKPYQAVVTVRTMPNTGSRRIVSDAVYAGERKSEQGRFGPYDIRTAVEIDAAGERAEVLVGMVRVEDDMQIFSHRFVAYLPASQMVR